MTGQTASTRPGRGTAPGGDHADPVANAVGEAATDATRPRLAQPGAPYYLDPALHPRTRGKEIAQLTTG